MAPAEQPLKKRKLYDPPPLSPSPSPSEPPPPPPVEPLAHPPQPSTPPPLSQEEIILRRRNQEEIRNVFECYKKIKFYIDQKDKRFKPEMEEPYRSLILAATGCASVKRIVAEYIPRYAPYCPAALESATKVIINMFEWCFSVISKGEGDVDIAFEIGKACVLGLVNICQAAASEATASAVTQAICSAVFLNVFAFLGSSFKGKGLFDIVEERVLKIHAFEESFSEVKHKFLEEDTTMLIKLSKLHALSFLKIFFSCPKDSIIACFELFKSSGKEGAQKGKYFLHQLTTELNDVGVHHLDEANVESSIRSSSTKYDGKQSSGRCPVLKGNSFSNSSPTILKNCLLGLVLKKDMLLKSLIFSRYRFLCESVSSEVVSVVTSVLGEVFESFVLQVKVEDSQVDGGGGTPGSSKSVNQCLVSGIPNQQGSPVFSGRDCPDKLSGIHLNRQSFSPRARTPMDFRSNSFNGRNRSPHFERSATSNMDLPMPASRSLTVAANSPFESPSPRQGIASPHSSTNHVIWYSDGDPAAMDIFPASKQLWLGSLGPDASEMHIKYQFEKFGPIDQLQCFPYKGFATIEFRNIMDALKAREMMRGRHFWGTCLRIKFLDSGLGTRGAINGTAAGSSCHVYIGNVPSIQAKDEMLHEVQKVLHKAPRAVIDVSSEGALLVEFDSPEEATISIAHLRRHRKENNKFFPPSNLGPTTAMMHAEGARPAPVSVHVDTRNTFPGYGPIGSPHDHTALDKPPEGFPARNSGLSSLLLQLRTKYNITHPQGSFDNHLAPAAMRERERVTTNTLWINIPSINPSCISDDELLAVCNLAISNTGSVVRISRTSMPAGSYWFVECSSPDAAKTLFKNLHECPGIFFQIEFSNPAKHHAVTPSVRPDGGALEFTSPRISQENCGPMMQNAHPFQSTWTAGGSSAPFSAHTPGSSIPPPQPAQAPVFIRPVFPPPPNSLWDGRGPGHHLPLKPIPPPVMAPNPHTNMRGPPFLPASVTPLAQIQGGSVPPFDPMFSRPVVPPPLSSLPPPPSNLPPLLPPHPNFRPPFLPHSELQPPLPPTPPPAPPPPPPPPYSQPPVFPPPPSSPPPPPPSVIAPPEIRPYEQYAWQGILSKSGVYYCTVHAQRVDSDIGRYSNAIAEPAEWPARLDMTKRTDLRHVRSAFSSTPPHRREICWMLPSSHGDQKGFQDFISYLKQRSCAGVIKIPSSKSLWTRLLFILPCSPETCSMLSIPPNPALSLIGLVVPKETNSDLT